MQKIINISGGTARMPEWRMARPVDFCLADGEHIAITGGNGSGKTLLTDMITGRHPLLLNGPEYDFAPSRKPLAADNIKYIAFRDSYGDTDGTYYLQQRWNQQEIDKETPIVKDILEQALTLAAAGGTADRQRLDDIVNMFGMERLLGKYVILLSSGELRKLQLAKALLAEPRVLIMDNPFIGLDADTRRQLKQLFAAIAAEKGRQQIILVLAKSDDIPEFITHVVEVKDRTVMPKITRQEYIGAQRPLPAHVLPDNKRSAIISLPQRTDGHKGTQVVEMNGVTVRYGERIILKDLCWTINRGQRWALSGQNGAGKSTLLSLVCADNPQAYAANIALFGSRRGSGESIWDIKKHIGYVSPEMHRAYRRNLPAIRIVASGLKDSVGLYVNPRPDEYEVCRRWMDFFGLKGMEDRPFLKLSSGEQRLVLLARAFVKDPELLILDEPLHGLDNRNRLLVKDIINAFCRREGKTLIMVTHYKEELPECITHHKELVRH